MARHGPSCDRAGAGVQAGAKRESFDVKAVPTGSGGQPWLGKGMAQSCMMAELSLSSGSRSSRKGEVLKAITL